MIPKPLKSGDKIGVIAPSDPVTNKEKQQLEKGVKFLENQRFEIKLGENIYKNTFGYSATPEEKVEDIHNMFKDDSINAIMAAQGGENANSILPYLDYQLIRNNPKIILGMSDITVLLNTIHKKAGLVTYHGHDLIWGLGKDRTEYDSQEFKERLIEEKFGEVNKNSKWKTIQEGKAKGKLVGGNLTCMVKLTGTKYEPKFRNKILFLESFGKSTAPSEIHWKLCHLKQLGVFDEINSLWLGSYKHESGIEIEKIVKDTLDNIHDFPILKCEDFGHNTPNTIIPIGVKANLDANNKKVILEK